MLEESKMDKKSLNRSSQPQSRASAIDCKKTTELTHKPWPRNNKKREGTGNTPKNEPYRKNVSSQRGRGQVDKRPRPRGPTNFAVGGTPNTGIEDNEEPEIGSVFVPGSKKQNFNHLLNFMYPSRSGTERRGPVPRKNTYCMPHKHEHDLYLRAYCQFVVKEDGDYKHLTLDPDLPIKWEEIEEVVVRSTGRSECPICLGSPVAGRVGRCGHVYCWACILHYTATHEKQPPPCPVCSTALQVTEMKPTLMKQWDSSNEEVTMRLVRRLRGSTIVEVAPPRGEYQDINETTMLPLEQLNKAPYAKLFSASKQEIFDILERERKELETQIYAEIDTTEVVYLEQALELLKCKEKKIKDQYEKPRVVEEAVDKVPTIYEKNEVLEKKIDWFDEPDEGASGIEVIEDAIKSIAINIQSELNPEAECFVHDKLVDNKIEEFPLIECPTVDSKNIKGDEDFIDIDKQNQAKYFYFYQAEDGQQVFLNSLNVRILNASWGVLAAAPNIIRGRIMNRETLSLSEQTRKHMPYTAHLPLYCSFDVVELDLQPPYVTEGAIKNFEGELERRARIRARHERDERRRERAYRRAMEGPPKPDISSELLFPPAPPSYGSPPLNEFVALSSCSSTNPSVISSPSAEHVSPSTSATSSSSGLSFAKMASASGTWRVRKTVATPPPPPPLEDEVSGPRALVLSDAIEAALQAVPVSSGKKNKKTKNKLLFATGMQRAG